MISLLSLVAPGLLGTHDLRGGACLLHARDARG